MFKNIKQGLSKYSGILAVGLSILIAPAQAAINVTSIMDDNAEWTIGAVGAQQFLNGTVNGIAPTAGVDTMHFNDAGSGTNTITFAGSPLAVGDFAVTIDVGNYNNGPLSTFNSLTDLGMTAGGTLLVPTSSNTPAPASGAIERWSYFYTITAADAQLGQDIGFTITVPNLASGGNVAFDNLAINQVTDITPTTTNGTVPGTAITYTITSDTGTPRAIFAGPNLSDLGTWRWTNDFPEFGATNNQTMTVIFSAPVPINRLILGVNSIGGIGRDFTLATVGGTASTADFDLRDGIFSVGAGTNGITYTGATGVFAPTGADQSLMIGSTSTNTITQLTLTGDNGADGYTLFFGTTAAPAVAVVAANIPTLSEWMLILLAMMLGLFATLKMKGQRGM